MPQIMTSINRGLKVVKSCS